MTVPRRIVVVAAALAGLRTAEYLRQLGFDGTLTLIGEEPHLPYDRPPLSKQVLCGEWEPARVVLRQRAALDALGIELRVGRRAVALRLGRQVVVELDDASQVSCDAVVTASGARPKQLAGPRLAGVHTLRTVDDALRIREEFTDRPRVAVVGGGFIGSEVAASARASGLDVTLIEGLAAPLAHVLGARVGDLCAQLHRAHGTVLRCGAGVEALVGSDRVEGVRLVDGTVVPADVVVVGIGVRPNTEWLADSAVPLADGVLCDEYGRAAERVYAAGDVARWWHPTFGEAIRVEHWTHAGEQARTVAHNLLHPDQPTALVSIPYVWSDQYTIKIQIAGRPNARHDVQLVHGEPDAGEFVRVYVHKGVVTGAVAFNNPRLIARWRSAVGRKFDQTGHIRQAVPAGRVHSC